MRPSLRMRLRTILVLVAASGLLCWVAANVTTWYLRRTTYRNLAGDHEAQAQSRTDQRNSEAYLHRMAAHYLPQFLAHPEVDVRRNTADYLRSPSFHPFSGPRSDWQPAVDAHRRFIERLDRNVAYHTRMAEGYRRAFSAPWWGVPSEPPPPKAVWRPDERP